VIYGYARISTDGQSVAAQLAQLTEAGAEKVFREVASGAKTDRAQLARDLLNTLATITEHKAGFRSQGEAWADTTTPHGRLMLTVLGGLAEFERELIRTRTGEGRTRAKARGQSLADRSSSRRIREGKTSLGRLKASRCGRLPDR